MTVHQSRISEGPRMSEYHNEFARAGTVRLFPPSGTPRRRLQLGSASTEWGQNHEAASGAHVLVYAALRHLQQTRVLSGEHFAP